VLTLSRVMDGLQRDLRDAWRGLRRAPGFAAIVVVTLALGIGANAAMFSLVDRLMFRPLSHLRDAASVHRIYWQWQEHGTATTTTATQYARYLDLQKSTTSFENVAAFYEFRLPVGAGDASRERRVSAVSASYFEFFDAQPALGRFFTRDEDRVPRGADVGVLSFDFWQSEFGGRDVRGETLQVGNVAATIIGVAPRGFDGVNDANPPAVYVPVTTYAASTGTDDSKTYYSRYQWGWVNVMVRRKPDVSRERAEADATQAFRGSWEAGRGDNPQHPPLDDAQPRVVVSSLRTGAGPNPTLEARTAAWLVIVSAIVLVIACANVANLFVARGLQRSRETAVRRALGIGRWRLVTRPLIESLMLAAVGGVAALVVAQWVSAALGAMLVATAAATPVFADLRTLTFTAGATLLVGVGVGLIPLVFASRQDVVRELRGGVRGGIVEGHRLRVSLLVMQAALSVVLLIGAALFVRSLQNVIATPMGYDADRVLLVTRVIRGPIFDDAAQRALRSSLLAAAQSLPGVESAAWVSSAPFISTSWTTLFVEGVRSVDALGRFTLQATTPDYFRTMGTRILRGRGLSDEDRLGAPAAAVVSESMARVLWPGQEALGRCFRMREVTAPCTTVVGVAEDIVQNDIAEGRRFHYYLSIDQYTRTWGNGLVVRLAGDPAREAEAVRAALQRVIPGEAYVTVQPLRGLVDTARRSWRLGATVFVAFGALTLVVAAVGLYGMIRFHVAERRHELGVRQALGAQRADVVQLIVRQGVAVAVAGVLLGVPLAMLAAHWVQPLLFEQSARDPFVYAAASAAMALVALGASTWPAVRAAREDPSSALRAE
jgi:putative ABC transport system permease protein